ncbi:MFS transporter [Streptomyces sp. NPDC051320]|uniref:MFS transporter n=1 Tax=Streptomyces sp. NPDC051320 TaxID=3154644 RepID=UPI003439E4F2
MTAEATAAPSVDADRSAPGSATLLVVLLPVFMVSLDFFIVNVAVPSITKDLHAGSAAIQFLVAGYGLAYAVMLITGGRLGDIVGRRRMYVIGLVLFTAASLLCGVAPNSGSLIVGRILQGLAAALMSPQALAFVNLLFTGAARAKAFAFYGLAIGLGGVLGQLVGGILIQADIAGLGWRSCFLINLPFGIVALVALPRLVGESKAPGRSRLDLVGSLLLAMGLTAVVLPLVEGRQQHWPLWSWVLLGAAAPLLALFAVYQHLMQKRGGSPLITLALFRERSFTVGILTELIYFSSSASFFLILAIYLQQGCGLDALEAGLLALPIGLGFLISSIYASKLAAKLGRQVLAIGAAVQIVGLIALHLLVSHVGVDGPLAELAPALFVYGVGSGLVMAPLVSVVLSRVSPQHAGAGSGALSTALQVGNSLGVAVIGIIFYGKLDHASPTAGPGVFGTAFNSALVWLTLFSGAVVILVQFLPGSRAEQST